jgi:superfamily II DNA or RNA helicase
MMQNIQWRPYQIACKEAIKSEYKKGITEQLIVEATGLGKRLQSINLMQHFDRSLFIAHREELIMQAYDDITRFWPMQVGIVKGPVFEIDKKIVVASVQTLYNRLDRIDPKLFDYVAFDESHHIMAKSYLKTIRHFKPKLLTGWTATPKRLDGLSLSNVFQKIVFEYKIEDGIKNGWLANIEAYQVQTQTDLSGVAKVAGDFNQKQLSERVDCRARNALIVDRYKKYCDGVQAIGFCVDINHAYNLRDIFREHGYIAEAVVSDKERCPNRTEIVEQFKKGNIQILSGVDILSEGFDYEDVGCALMARPTQSETLYIQMIGRATRLKSKAYEDKFGHAKATILDFVDNGTRHSLVNTYELEKAKRIEDRIFISDSDRSLLIKAREKRIREIEVSTLKDKKVNLFKLPEIIVWQSEKMLEPATEKQIKWIKDLGLYQEDVEYTKAMASELISARPAGAVQRAELREWGYDISGDVTKGQYSRVKFLRERKNKYKFEK